MKAVLVAINAQYVHTNLAVRSITACAKESGISSVGFVEYTINQHGEWVLEQLYALQADVYLFSCYIWNIEMVEALAADLRKLRPDAELWAGGPQVSYHSADFLHRNPAFNGVLKGEGEETGPLLLQALQAGTPLQRVPGIVYRHRQDICENQPPLPPDMNSLPFAYADLEKLDGRILYYESMRGCPFGCSYCLSSVEKGVRLKDLALVQKELDRFLAAKPRQVKFVDRTFNGNRNHALAVWQYLAKNDNGVTNFHFELAGELLSEEELAFLAGVRPGLFQFEIGVQSTNENTLREINRFTGLDKLFSAVQRLNSGGNIHLHLDLIAGLPFEDYASFVRSFNTVYTQCPHQLQLGFLKVLAGSEMERKAEGYGLVYSSAAPFEVLRTQWISYAELSKLGVVAQMVELYYNSGRFTYLVALLCGRFSTPFAFYECLAALFDESGYRARPLGKMGQYELLGVFMQKEGLLDLFEKAQWLCRVDMARHEKIKNLPGWVAVDGAAALHREILDFYADEGCIQKYLPGYEGLPAKQIRRMAHIEVLPFHPETGKKKQTVLLFDYRHRDLEGRALMQDVSDLFT